LLADCLGTAIKDIEEVRLLECESRISLSVHLKGPVRAKVPEALEPLIREGLIAGALLLPGESKGAIVTLGSPVLEDAGLFHRPDGFAQANAAVNDAMVARCVEWLELSKRSQSVLELYSGNGNFTFAMAADAAQITAVESSAVSVQLAQQAASARGIVNVRFVQNDAEKSADGLVREGARFDRMLLDPPRSGAPKVGTWASRLLATKVVYVACDPASLARDAQALVGQGFRATSLQLFDLFPQTPHIEAVMAFSR
jgi:23S rRNA (uracil1939-C5)-methyltransferase